MVDYTLTDDMEANAATFNILFGDVNLRLKELEKAGSALKKARDEIVDLGLARINEVVGPALQAVEDISDLSDLFRAATLSSVEIGTGVREFNIEPGDRLKFAAPLYVAIAVNGQLDKWMAGQVQSWNNETGQLMVDVTNIRGEGIFADWVVTPTHIPETGPTINAYTKAEVDAIVAQAKADLLGGSPAAALDTLSELAAALADDASFAATITAQLAGKADANALGALAALDTVDTAQIVDGAITEAKLASGLELGGPSLGDRSIIRYNERIIKTDVILWEYNTTCTADDTADTINKGTNDNFANKDIVQLSTTGTLPAGLATATDYYVRDIAASTLKLAATETGAAIDITDTGTGTHTIYKPVNGMTVGPIVVGDGVTVTVKDGSTWSVV